MPRIGAGVNVAVAGMGVTVAVVVAVWVGTTVAVWVGTSVEIGVAGVAQATKIRDKTSKIYFFKVSLLCGY